MNKGAAAGKHGRVDPDAKDPPVKGSCRGSLAGVWRGMRKLRKWAGMMEEETYTIVNKTGKPVVVRAKYKDVWEGQQWRLAAEGGQMVVPAGLLKSSQPYCRLGAFLEPDPSSSSHLGVGCLLYITSRDVLSSPRIALSLSRRSSSSADLQLFK